MLPEQDLHYLAHANARTWLYAVIVQRKRCEDALFRIRHFTDLELNARLRFEEAISELQIEEHFFVVAVARAVLWVTEFTRYRPEFAGPSKEFLKAAPQSKDLRNMREHDLSYFKGQGYNPERFVFQHRDARGVVDAISDATSSTVTGSEYLLGGRLDIRVISRLAAALRELMPYAGEWLRPPLPAGLSA